MRVFATDLDGCVADISKILDNAIRKEFKVKHVIKPDSYYGYDKYGVEEVLGEPFVRKLLEDPNTWNDALPIRKNIAEMQKWVMAGLVPSVITGRKPLNRIITEFWLAKNDVPYSNLLMGASTDKGKLCYHIDASFFIEDTEEACFGVLEQGIKCYMPRHPYNRTLEETNTNPLLVFVDDYTEISELEKIK